MPWNKLLLSPLKAIMLPGIYFHQKQCITMISYYFKCLKENMHEITVSTICDQVDLDEMNENE